jgi:hypothetical protein
VAIDVFETPDRGETHPLVRKGVRKRRLGTEERRLILKVIGIIHFRRSAYGMSAEQVLFEVSESIKRTENTIKSWERQLKKEAPLGVSRAIAFAENQGSWVAEQRKKQLGQTVDEGHRDRAKRFTAQYDEAALAQLSKDIERVFVTQRRHPFLV